MDGKTGSFIANYMDATRDQHGYEGLCSRLGFGCKCFGKFICNRYVSESGLVSHELTNFRVFGFQECLKLCKFSAYKQAVPGLHIGHMAIEVGLQDM